MTVRILIIEDDEGYADILERIAEDEGFDPMLAGSGEEGLERLEELRPALVLCDIGLPGMDGIETIEQISRRDPQVVTIIVSGQATLENAVKAMRAGAFDVLQKTADPDEIQLRLRRAMDTASLRRQLEYLQTRDSGFGEIVGDSPAMREVRRRVEEVAASPSATVLIVGETGTGKELLARAVHRVSARRDKAFIAVNCAAVPDNLVESEFFGHERGAFTGAERARAGLFEMAHGGSLFLDEIGELDLKLQAKLLRVLEERVLMRVGGTREIRVDVRLIAATNRDLAGEVAAGRFREDLLYRINVFRIDLPPLRERGEDVLRLTRHFMGIYGNELGKRVTLVDPLVERALSGYHFPGNVRQLRNLVEQAMIVARGDTLTPDLLRGLDRPSNPAAIAPPPGTAPGSPPGDGDLEQQMRSLEQRRGQLDLFEKQLVEAALEASKGNKTKAAERLGISRYALIRRLKRHDLS